MQGTQEAEVQSPGRKDTLEEGKATHSGILAWRIPRTEKPGGPPSVGLREAWQATVCGVAKSQT